MSRQKFGECDKKSVSITAYVAFQSVLKASLNLFKVLPPSFRDNILVKMYVFGIFHILAGNKILHSKKHEILGFDPRNLIQSNAHKQNRFSYFDTLHPFKLF